MHLADFQEGQLMPDDPNNRGPQDRKRVSQQEHEQRYQKGKKKRESTESRKKKSK